MDPVAYRGNLGSLHWSVKGHSEWSADFATAELASRVVFTS